MKLKLFLVIVLLKFVGEIRSDCNHYKYDPPGVIHFYPEVTHRTIQLDLGAKTRVTPKIFRRQASISPQIQTVLDTSQANYQAVNNPSPFVLLYPVLQPQKFYAPVQTLQTPFSNFVTVPQHFRVLPQKVVINQPNEFKVSSKKHEVLVQLYPPLTYVPPSDKKAPIVEVPIQKLGTLPKSSVVPEVIFTEVLPQNVTTQSTEVKKPKFLVVISPRSTYGPPLENNTSSQSPTQEIATKKAPTIVNTVPVKKKHYGIKTIVYEIEEGKPRRLMYSSTHTIRAT